MTSIAIGLLATGLAACSAGGSSQPSAAGPSAPAAVTSTAPPAPPVSPQVKAQASAAAAHVLGLYSASQFAAFWNLMSPAMKHQIPRRIWVNVHSACQSADAHGSRTIEAVTVFGNAAIITESIAGSSRGRAEDIFNYVDGNWSYSPQRLSIYQHGSVAADIAAARAAGFCASWKIF